MKIGFALAALSLIAVPTAILAQDAPAAPAAQAKFTLDTPIETIAADPAGKAVLDAVLPGLLAHEAYPMFKAMSLRQVQPMSQGNVTEDQLKKAEAELAKL